MSAHNRLMSELVATMAANTRTPLHDIKVTVGAADLDAELGSLRETRAALTALLDDFDDSVEAENARAALAKASPDNVGLNQ